MKKEIEVKVYKVHFYCDKCDKEVKFTGFIGMTNPPKYKHICECGELYWLDNQYPKIEFK